MSNFKALRSLPADNIFQSGDVFVLFGELFGRGYVNGLVDEARKAGMKIIGATVGRRDENNTLRPLNNEELQEAEDTLGGRVINVPLMAGYDLDAPEGTSTPTDLLATLKINNWMDAELDWDHIDACHEAGISRFRNSLDQFMVELDKEIPDGSNVFFAHTMAGGIPRTKIFLAIANRVYKGHGKRFLSSRDLIDSDLGKFMLSNFKEVTANTFQYLIDASDKIRDRITNNNGQVRYIAYGYHGTEILIDDHYEWQTYTNYTQGYAKMHLEEVAEKAWEQGIKATVFNCPEIRTNSSDIFLGVELSLFPLLLALEKENGSQWPDQQWQTCQALLNDDIKLDDILQRIQDYNNDNTIAQFRNFTAWPMDSTPELAELMVGTSRYITDLHKDKSKLIADHLSSLVLEGTGPIIFHEASKPSGPALWLGHDIIAKQLNQMHS